MAVRSRGTSVPHSIIQTTKQDMYLNALITLVVTIVPALGVMMVIEQIKNGSFLGLDWDSMFAFMLGAIGYMAFHMSFVRNNMYDR